MWEAGCGEASTGFGQLLELKSPGLGSGLGSHICLRSIIRFMVVFCLSVQVDGWGRPQPGLGVACRKDARLK